MISFESTKIDFLKKLNEIGDAWAGSSAWALGLLMRLASLKHSRRSSTQGTQAMVKCPWALIYFLPKIGEYFL